MIALAAYIRVEDNDYNSVFGKGGPFAPANIMIAAGVFVFLVSFLGCCGAMKQHKCMLILVSLTNLYHIYFFIIDNLTFLSFRDGARGGRGL